MLKSALSRQSRLCRLPITARPLQLASQIPTRSLLARSTRSRTRAVSRHGLPGLWTRSYSALANATVPAEEVDGSAEGAAAGASEADGVVTRFENLSSLGVHENVVRSITEGMGYETMSQVQSMTIQPALAGKDIVAQAKTGTGKTLAFLIPVIQRIIDADPNLAFRGRHQAQANDIRAIILSPTRELAEQIGVEARKLCRNTGLIVQTAVGGTGKREMLRRTQRQGCHLLIATPGRLLDILSDESSGIDAPRLAALVLDEADRMLDVGFEDSLKSILSYLPERSEQPRQTLLFSATIPTDVVRLAKAYVDPKNFEFVQTVRGDDTPTHAKVPQFIVPCKGFENFYPAILELIYREVENNETPFKAIVFLPTTSFVELTTATFANIAHRNPKMPEVLGIHSKLTQRARTSNAEYFRRAKSAILISSDVTARGMDFPNVSHVIQVSCPPDREQYIHRIGRTGRADKTGQGWLFVSEIELYEARKRLTDLPIKRNMELKTATLDLGAEDLETTEHETVKAVSSAIQGTDPSTLTDAYRSLLGGAMKTLRRQDLLDTLNNLTKHGWGMEKPPAISAALARNTGLAGLRGVNISNDRFVDRGGDRFGDRGSDSFGGSRGGGFGGSRGSGFRSSGDRDSFRPSGDRDSFRSSGGRDGFRPSGGRDGFRPSGGRDGFRSSGGRGGGFRSSGGRDGFRQDRRPRDGFEAMNEQSRSETQDRGRGGFKPRVHSTF